MAKNAKAIHFLLGAWGLAGYPLIPVIAKAHTAAPFYPPAPHGDPTVTVKPIRAYLQVRGYTCGYASTLTVLHAFQKRINPLDLYQRLGTDHGGTGQTAILRELREGGVSANLRYDLDFDTLRRTIDAGKLIIGYHHRVEHWVVIYGYGVSPERVFIADPVVEWRSEHLWERYGPKLKNFGIVCSGRRRARTTSVPTVEVVESAASAPPIRSQTPDLASLGAQLTPSAALADALVLTPAS